MFWKKRQQEPKAKKLSPKEIMSNQIEQLSPGQTLSYRLPETYGGGLVIVELNPQYPKKGRKYVLSTEKLVDGKPAGERCHFLDYDKPKDLSNWVLERQGKLFS